MLNVFSSARVLRSYTMEQLVGLGIGWVWMGIEGKNSRYRKLEDVDTHRTGETPAIPRHSRSGFIHYRLEHHTPENIDQVIAHAVSHGSGFSPVHALHPGSGNPPV